MLPAVLGAGSYKACVRNYTAAFITLYSYTAYTIHCTPYHSNYTMNSIYLHYTMYTTVLTLHCKLHYLNIMCTIQFTLHHVHLIIYSETGTLGFTQCVCVYSHQVNKKKRRPPTNTMFLMHPPRTLPCDQKPIALACKWSGRHMIRGCVTRWRR